MKLIFKKIFLFSSIFCLSLPVFSDVDTTSGMRGSVNVSGATVEAEHTPTGITKTTTTSSTGSFSISFLPLGGPYTVKVSAPGYNSESIDGLFLSLGDPLSFGVTLTSTTAADEIIVTAKPAEAFKMGTSTILTREDMDAVPTINRQVADFAKMDPRVSVNGGVGRDAEISIMGANSRFNDFTIDGISFNDPFGLNDNGFGTMRNPISMDSYYKDLSHINYKERIKQNFDHPDSIDVNLLEEQTFIPRLTFLIYTNENYSYKDFYSKKQRYFYLKKNLEKKFRFERIIFQQQDNNKLGIVIHSKNIEFINSYLNAKDEEVFKQKIIANFNKLFEDNSVVNKLTFDEKISIMKWRASQPSGIAVPLSLQVIKKYRIGFCGDWFEGEGFGRIEGSILSALILEKKLKF